jgi:peptidoglycan/LPS O-acetylase OafA/YrhL
MCATADRPTGARDSALDGLRGIAIGLVLWHHLLAASLPLGRDSWLGWLRAGTGLAWCGVDLFFVLSGFFIGGILIDRRDSPRLARVFYLRRAMRILPLYYVTLGVTFLAIAARMPGGYHEFSPWVYATFLTNFALASTQTWDWLPLSVLWSLAIEEQFYLTAPWVVRAISPSRLPWLVAGLAAGAWLARALLLVGFPSGNFAAHVLMPLRMDGLALGALVAWAVRHEAARPFFALLTRRWPGVLGLGFAALAVIALLHPREGSPLLCLVGYTLLATVFALVVAIVAGVRPPMLVGLLSARPLAHLGRHSYFIYLWHALIGTGIVRELGGADFRLSSPVGLGIVALAIAATWGAATVSWRFFEAPFIAWGQQHRY